MKPLSWFVFLASLASAPGCQPPSPPAASAPGPSVGPASVPAPQAASASVPVAPVPSVGATGPVLTERRLHVLEAGASSILTSEKAAEPDRYHPNHAFDGDPTYAWCEGRAGSGAGEWLEAPLTATEGVVRVRLRVMNGYQRNERLFAANARAKSIEIVLQPGGESATLALADTLGWQELVAELPAGRVESLRATVKEVYPGSKYDDLCLSELELYLTASSKDDPLVEIKKRQAAAEWTDNHALLANELALASEYAAEEIADLSEFSGRPWKLRSEYIKLLPRGAKAFYKALPDLSAALWLEASPIPPGKVLLPKGFDNQCVFGDEGSAPSGERGDAVPLPCIEGSTLLNLKTFTLVAGPPVAFDDCPRDSTPFLWGLWTGGAEQPPAHLAVMTCLQDRMDVQVMGSMANRGRPEPPPHPYTNLQTLSYDQEGRLRVMVEAYANKNVWSEKSQTEQWFDWQLVDGAPMVTEVVILKDDAVTRYRALLPAGAKVEPLPAPMPVEAPSSLPASAPASAPVGGKAP